MCKTVLFTSTTCSHAWMTLSYPCGPGANLSTCHRIAYGMTLPGNPPKEVRVAKSCPECDRNNEYDGDHTRMIEAVQVTPQQPRSGHQQGSVVCCLVM